MEWEGKRRLWRERVEEGRFWEGTEDADAEVESKEEDDNEEDVTVDEERGREENGAKA